MLVYAFDLMPWPHLDFGSLPHARAQKNVELFAKHVLPALERG